MKETGAAMIQHMARDQIAGKNAKLTGRKYLTFSMDQMEYGTGILKVEEINNTMRIHGTLHKEVTC